MRTLPSTTPKRTSPESLRRQNGGKGADVILDVVGAKYLQQNVEALAEYGRLVVIGLQGGTKGELDLVNCSRSGPR